MRWAHVIIKMNIFLFTSSKYSSLRIPLRWWGVGLDPLAMKPNGNFASSSKKRRAHTHTHYWWSRCWNDSPRHRDRFDSLAPFPTVPHCHHSSIKIVDDDIVHCLLFQTLISLSLSLLCKEWDNGDAEYWNKKKKGRKRRNVPKGWMVQKNKVIIGILPCEDRCHDHYWSKYLPWKRGRSEIDGTGGRKSWTSSVDYLLPLGRHLVLGIEELKNVELFMKNINLGMRQTISL